MKLHIKQFFYITAILFMAPICVFAQVSILSPSKPKTITKERYDSLSNIDKNNILNLEGQTLFMNGEVTHKNSGWDSMFYPNKEHGFGASVFRPGRYNFVSDYNKMVGRYYNVLSVEKDKNKLYGYIICLEDRDSKETFYWFWDGIYNPSYFTVVGYYEKTKQNLVGRNYYCFDDWGVKNIDDKEVSIPFKVPFKCIDVQIAMDTNGSSMFAILLNSKYGKIKSPISEMRITSFISTVNYNKYIKKYGNFYGNKVAKGEVEIGMTKQMVKDAWGLPEKINYTEGSYGKREQWVYDNRYLYFKNGKMTDYQSF